MITSLETIKKTLNINYNVFDLENNIREINNNGLIEFTREFQKKNSFINGIGWGEANITQNDISLYVVNGMNFARRIAMAGKAQYCPIISYCATTHKQIKMYSDIILDPTSSENKNYLETLKIRNDEGMSHGMNINCQKIIKNQEIMINIFISWGDKKINEKKFFDKNYHQIKKFLNLSVDFIKNKYKGKEHD